MVNVGFGWSSLVGIILALSGVGLYFLRAVRPALARDYDIALSVVALVCGGILFFNGWRQDPILQFGQLMLSGMTIWFAIEALRLRGIATEQAKRNTPIVDDDRPISKVYRAELDDFAPLDRNSTTTRRIRGRDDRSDEPDRYEDSRRPGSRTSRPDSGSDRTRTPRSSRPLPPDRSESRSDWDDDVSGDRDEWGSSPNISRPGVKEDRVSNRPRRRPSDPSARRRDSNSTDYVDYQPIDYPDEPNRPRDY